MNRTHERTRDLLSAAFILRRPVTVTTADNTYADIYVLTVVDAEPTAGEVFVLLSRSNDPDDAVGITVDQVTAISGIADDDVRRAALIS